MLPTALRKIWTDLEEIRASVLKEIEGLTQAQADWCPSERDWSAGELIHHLTLAEIATGKLISKLIREGGAQGRLRPYPDDVREFEPLPLPPPGPAEAPPIVQPEHGHAIEKLLEELRTVRARTRENVERLATVDPRQLTHRHFQLGDLHLAQWVALQARHDAIHLAQMRDVKASPGFPA